MYQTEQLSILIITIFLGVSFWLINKKLRRRRGDESPGRMTAAIISYVRWIDNYTVDAMGKDVGRKYSAYMSSVFIYILVSNLSGLVGLTAPTSNWSVTLALAGITWVSIQYMSIRTNGFKGYIQSFFEPFTFFVIPNIFGQIAPLISLSMRLFGNIVAGSTIMSLFYAFTGWVTSFIPIIGDFNFLGVIIAPILHLYFDLFSGFLQAFIFLSLSMIFIGVEGPQEN
jgi:F-type H+-transporting ATPase subunit a